MGSCSILTIRTLHLGRRYNNITRYIHDNILMRMCRINRRYICRARFGLDSAKLVRSTYVFYFFFQTFSRVDTIYIYILYYFLSLATSPSVSFFSFRFFLLILSTFLPLLYRYACTLPCRHRGVYVYIPIIQFDDDDDDDDKAQ